MCFALPASHVPSSDALCSIPFVARYPCSHCYATVGKRDAHSFSNAIHRSIGVTTTMQPIEERLDLVRFKVDKTPHIRVNRETCKDCDTQACVYVCPAGLFEMLGGEMHFSY